MSVSEEHGFQEIRDIYNYVGSSMWPTLIQGDGLWVEPYTESESVIVGDVVVFCNPIYHKTIVHRVAWVAVDGIHTRGDNNSDQDTLVLQPIDIVGKVIAVSRKKVRISVKNGFPGRLICWKCRMQQFMLTRLRVFCAPLYRWLVRVKIFCLPSAWLCWQVLSFQRAENEKILLRIFRRWIIGTYDLKRQRWVIQNPFCLFVDVGDLPDIEQEM